MAKRDLHLDFETYCDLDLSAVGVHEYVNDPSFEVLCAAWKIDGAPVVSTPGTGIPEVLVTDPDIQGHAWNAAFETAVLERLGVKPANPLSCTMQRALAYGLPAKLEAAGAALGAPVQKDMAGAKLMKRLSRPDKKTGARVVANAAELIDLQAYCARDVEAEEAIGALIPQLQPEERALSLVDAAMNREGVGVDLVRVANLRRIAEEAEKIDAARCKILTGGEVTSPGTQTARLLAWLNARGLAMPDVARATVEDKLAEPGHSPVVEEVLRIRLRMARASTKKLARMRVMGGATGVLRHQFQFCGAGRTGRWSGRGIQPQNLPRVPKGFSPDMFHAMAEIAILSHTAGLDRISPAPLLDCVAWSLRSCLWTGYTDDLLWGFDFSQIEARVLAWLAGQQDVLSVFRSGEDVYVWAAAQFGSSNRQLGKVLILALGYGMGAVKLQEMARVSYGVTLTAGQAERFKSEWRTRNSHIVRFWAEIEAAAQQAIVARGRVVPVGGSGIAFVCTARTLQMRLPSGRVLYYHKPFLAPDTGSIGYWGPGTGGVWIEQRTYGGKLAENATQAVARDVMSEAMLRMWRREKLVPLMTIHDELVYRLPRKFSGALAAAYKKLALEAPPWAGGLPIDGEAKIMTRYGVPI